MGLRQVPDLDPGTGARPDHRQRHPHRRFAGSGAGGQVRRPFTPVPPGNHLCPCRHGAAALNAGAVGGRVRGSTAAAGRCLEGRDSQPRGASCRRDAGGDAQAGQ